MACDAVEPETEAVFYDQGEDATLSASRDPRRRNCADVGRHMMSEEILRTPKTLPTERYDLSPVHGSNLSGMFNFEELEARSPSEESGVDAVNYRGLTLMNGLGLQS